MILTADLVYGLILLVILGMFVALVVDSRRRATAPKNGANGASAPSLAARITVLEERLQTLDAHYADLKMILTAIQAQQQEQATERQVYLMARRIARKMQRDAERKAAPGPTQHVTIAGGDALRAGNIGGSGIGIGREAQGSNETKGGP